MKPNAVRLQTLVNVAGAALLYWLAAPLLAINGAHPFDSALARGAGLAALLLLLVAAWSVRSWLRRRRNARLFTQLQGADTAASEALALRFSNAMNLLRAGIDVGRGAKSARGGLNWPWRRRRQVYELPWYVFIGAPGAGKTTALLHSGLRFPLAERLGAAPVAGIGGTRQCDWWFTDRAVFIDTAGRYTTQDSHHASDAQEWQTFLRLLRRYRPVQPINGVIVTVSVPDLIHGGAELASQAEAVEQRLLELRAELGLSFPVYLLVTKVDLLAGFVEFFGDFDAARREHIWGTTFEYPGPNDAAALPADLGARLAELARSVADARSLRLQEEPVLQRRALVYQFPAQLEAVLPALEVFARRAFRRTVEAPRQALRGVYLSSGTQEGNPIDRVLGQLSRSYGFPVPTRPRPDGGGKAYFLASLLQNLVIAEAPLAGTNLKRRQRKRWLLGSAGSVIAAALVLACVGWWYSYRSNLEYVESISARVDKVMREVDPAKSKGIDQLLPLYAMLSDLASSGAVDAARPPFGFDFGLFQGARLAQSADQTYHRVLDQTLAPLLTQRLQQALRDESDPAARYDALRISLMLLTPNQLQRSEVRRWAAQAFAARPPKAAASTAGSAAAAASAASAAATASSGQAPGAGEQQEWLRHLDALLERNAVLNVMRLDEPTLRAARTALAALPIEQRVYDRLLARARAQFEGEKSLAELVSPGAVLAFAPQDAASGVPTMPAVYTQRAWREAIEPALDPTIAELANEAGWVMDDKTPATQRLARERGARVELAKQIAASHAQATIAQWDRLFGVLALQLPADPEGLSRSASALAAPTSPLRELYARVASEFPAPAAGASPVKQVFETAVNARFGTLADYARGAGVPALDRLVAPLPAVLGEAGGPRATELGRELRAEAARTPAPVKAMWTALADALGTQQRRALDKQLTSGIGELASACRRITAERYPFAREAMRDMPYADFSRLFGPRGLLDSFFRSNLASQVDTQKRPWRLSGEATPSDKAQATLRSFEMAEDIRRLFFPAGAELPQLRLRLTPLNMDSDLLLFSADVDGQLMRYENGPRRPKAVVWPGPASTQRVLLRILPPGPSGVGAEAHEGPWALLRVLSRHGLQRGAGGSVARLDVDGRSLNVEVASEAPVSAGLLADLGNFRCPEAW